MYVRSIQFALPQSKISSAEIAEQTGLEESFITEKIGIKERRFLGADETQVGLAEKACRKLFDENTELDPNDIPLLIMVTQTPDYRIPHSSAILQDALGMNTNVACFDINLGCSGYVYALSVAKGLMAAQEYQNALVVTCDPYSKIMGKTDRNTIPLFGDGASATWLSAEKGASIGRCDFGTDGQGASDLMISSGGAANPASSYYASCINDADDSEFRLNMNGRAIFEFAALRVPDSIEKCLSANNLTKDEIDYFIFHQGSAPILKTLTRKLGLPPEKVPTNIELIGNTVSSSIPILVSELAAKGALAGKTILLCGFGVGLSWGSTILRFD